MNPLMEEWKEEINPNPASSLNRTQGTQDGAKNVREDPIYRVLYQFFKQPKMDHRTLETTLGSCLLLGNLACMAKAIEKPNHQL